MPGDFEACRKGGGRIRTISGPNKEHGLSANQYIHYCYLNGKSFRGEVKTKGKETAKAEYAKAAKKKGVI